MVREAQNGRVQENLAFVVFQVWSSRVNLQGCASLGPDEVIESQGLNRADYIAALSGVLAQSLREIPLRTGLKTSSSVLISARKADWLVA